MLGSTILGQLRSARRRTSLSSLRARQARSASDHGKLDSTTSSRLCNRLVPPQNLAVPHNDFITRSHRHRQVIQGLTQIEARLQKLVAELVMLRLFDEFQ